MADLQEMDAALTRVPDAGLLGPLLDEQLDPLFWRAARASPLSAWTAHVPFAHWVIAAHRPRSSV